MHRGGVPPPPPSLFLACRHPRSPRNNISPPRDAYTLLIYLLTADHTKKAMGSMRAMTTDPPYAAIFALPATFLLPLAFGSIFTFRYRAVVVPAAEEEEEEEEDAAAAGGAPNEYGPSGARSRVGGLAREDRAEEGGWIAVNADAGVVTATTTTTTTRRMDAINLFMVMKSK